ncbi:MAG: Mrp/NBP35 family ATP-binding protein [Tannerellaceae bacterium]|jgi:ATP-binding protein involved in chromosome partitioning|nr:Mrp/NBP35 family ATP-binding protein [Tannerellaceae bacterium]
MISPEEILQALRRVRYPGTKSNIIDEGLLSELQIDGLAISFTLTFTKAGSPFSSSVSRAVRQVLTEKFGRKVKLNINLVPYSAPAPSPAPGGPANMEGVRHIIAVASGKGGVGKSTIAANLSIALARSNYSVGLLDADVYGPSQPIMFSSGGERPVSQNSGGRDMIQPVVSHGVRHLSIGHFVAPADALIWRGAMATNAIRQLIENTAWGPLDFLIVDLPPGTGDVHLTIVQTLKLSGAVIVTTPQSVALADARKAISMFQNPKVGVPILGIIENMSWFTPAELPSNRYYLFGRDGGSLLATESRLPLLAQIPIIQSICESADAGLPEALRSDSPAAATFVGLAARLAECMKEK